MAPEVPKPNKGRPSKSSLAKLEEEGRNNKNAKHKCRFCPRVFPRKKNKDAHERTHLGLKPFRCDFPGCRKAFVQSCQLRAHTYLHTGEKPFACPATGLKPFRCDFPGCRKAFVQSCQLRAHTYLHTGEKPFACPATGCRVRYPHSNRRCSRHKLKLIRDGKEVIRTDLENLSKAQIRWLQLYKEKKFGKATKVSIPKTSPTEVRNVKRKKSAESVHVDEKPFDEEPLISSNPSTSSAHNPEEMNICDSFAQPPKKARFTKKQAALVLISFKNSHISCNPSSSPAHNPEEMNICDSLAQSPKKARFTKKQAALALISFKNSHISSNPSSSPAPNPEEMNIYDSLAQPPKKARFTKKQAALALISLKNSHISSNPSSSPAHNPEEMNICDSFAQPPKKAPLSDKKAALILISLSNGPPRMNGHLEDKKSS